AIQGAGLVYIYQLGRPLPARAFLRGGNRTIPLSQAQAKLCIELEPLGDSFEADQVDIESVKLTAFGVGNKTSIPALSEKTVSSADIDRNGIHDLPVYFARSDFTRL